MVQQLMNNILLIMVNNNYLNYKKLGELNQGNNNDIIMKKS